MAKYVLKKSTHPINFQDIASGLWIRLEGEGLGWEEFVSWEEWNRLIAWTNWRQLEHNANRSASREL